MTDRKIVDYMMITIKQSAYSGMDLSNIRESIKEGWKPLGALTFIKEQYIYGLGKYKFFKQSMVKYEEDYECQK